MFYLTNHYLETGNFFNEYLIAKQKLKAIFIILFEPIDSKFNLETIIEMDQLNVIKYDDQNKKISSNSLYRMWYLILKELNKNVEYNETAHHEFQLTSVDSVRRRDQSSHTNGLKMINGLFLKKHLFRSNFIENYQIYDVPESNHLIVLSDELNLFIFDRNTLNFIRKTKLKLKTFGHPTDLCFVKCLNKICFISTDSLFSMNTDYDQVQMEKKHLLENYYHGGLMFICTKNEKIYIYDDYEHKTLVLNANGFHKIDHVEMINIPSPPVKSMKIINESMFYLTKSSIFVYDLDLKFVFKFGSILASAESLLSSDKLNNYLFTLDKKNLKIFSLDNFKYFGSVDINHKNVILKDSKALLAGDNLIINCDNRTSLKTEITMFKLNFNFSSVKNVNEDFMCKMNTYNMHLLKNPIELPCGNYSCLECVHDNYNLARNEFKCSFKNCNKNHQELRGYCVESNIIQNSLYEICNNQIDHSKEKISGIRNDNGKILFFFNFKIILI